jgi:ankyrin repeat protein
MKLTKHLLVFVWLLSFLLAARAGAFEDFFAAVRSDNESTVVALTLRGFDLNTVDEKGESGLLIALRQGSLKVADFLLQQNSVKVEARNAQGESPLMLAALKGHLPQAQRLIRRGAEVNKPGWTPLHYAASNPEPVGLDLVRLLLEHHAYIDAESPNRSTPLMMAARYGTDAVVKMLLEEGADPLVRNEQGLSAIDFARQVGRDGSVDLIARQVRARQPAGRW